MLKLRCGYCSTERRGKHLYLLRRGDLLHRGGVGVHCLRSWHLPSKCRGQPLHRVRCGYLLCRRELLHELRGGQVPSRDRCI